MDTTNFDELTRHLGYCLTRRGTLRAIVAGAMTLASGGTISEDAIVKQRSKERRK